MNNNFNVVQFAELQARARQVFVKIIENIKEVKKTCETISGIVRSEDSGLAGSWSNTSSSLNEPINSSNMIFDGINSGMTQYAADVIANEEKEIKNVEEYNSSISALAGAATALSESINGGKSFAGDSITNTNILKDDLLMNSRIIDMNGNYTDSNGERHNISETKVDTSRTIENIGKDGLFRNSNGVDMNGSYTDSNGVHHQNNLDGTWTHTYPDGTSKTHNSDHLGGPGIEDISQMRNSMK